jgi:hypothetical protein
MLERDKSLTTQQKSLAINLDDRKYGTIVEIGAGQEVARQFFKAGAAAGTVAKTMSAYDMRVSDEIYGQVGRYVSRERVEQMLGREFDLLIDRLQENRSKDTTFFSYAATVAARGYNTSHECHGWIGLRFQLQPNEEPCQIVMHVRMLDNNNESQSEALGVLGVNLIYGAFTHSNEPKWIIDGLNDGLGSDRVEVDLIHFSGPGFGHINNRLKNLHLIRAWLTRAVMYSPEGTSVVPSEHLYRKSALVIRGAFMPPTKVHSDMAKTGLAQLKEGLADAKEALVMAEISMSTLAKGGGADDEEFLARADLVNAMGYNVLVSDYVRTFSLRSWIRRYTHHPIGLAVKATDCDFLFDESFYDGLEGGIMEAMGKLFADDTRMFIYPANNDDDQLISLENLRVPEQHKYLLKLLIENKKMLASEDCNEDNFHFSARKLLSSIAQGPGDWEEQLPEEVLNLIVERKLFGYSK